MTDETSVKFDDDCISSISSQFHSRPPERFRDEMPPEQALDPKAPPPRELLLPVFAVAMVNGEMKGHLHRRDLPKMQGLNRFLPHWLRDSPQLLKVCFLFCLIVIVAAVVLIVISSLDIFSKGDSSTSVDRGSEEFLAELNSQQIENNPFPTASPVASDPNVFQTQVPTVVNAVQQNDKDGTQNKNDYTKGPTAAPTVGTANSRAIQTSWPTREPTVAPIAQPTTLPTSFPTNTPTNGPTALPTGVPTLRPTTGPSPVPTAQPSRVPTRRPTRPPMRPPTPRPTWTPVSQESLSRYYPTRAPVVAPVETDEDDMDDNMNDNMNMMNRRRRRML